MSLRMGTAAAVTSILHYETLQTAGDPCVQRNCHSPGSFNSLSLNMHPMWSNAGALYGRMNGASTCETPLGCSVGLLQLASVRRPHPKCKSPRAPFHVQKCATMPVELPLKCEDEDTQANTQDSRGGLMANGEASLLPYQAGWMCDCQNISCE